MLAIKAGRPVKILLNRQEELVKEWGLEVKERAPQIPDDLTKTVDEDKAKAAQADPANDGTDPPGPKDDDQATAASP